MVTGASGYLAIHCVQYLLRTGYLVRGTVRDLNCDEKIGPLKLLTNSDNLELYQADLADDVAVWEKFVCITVKYSIKYSELAFHDMNL